MLEDDIPVFKEVKEITVYEEEYEKIVINITYQDIQRHL